MDNINLLNADQIKEVNSCKAGEADCKGLDDGCYGVCYGGDKLVGMEGIKVAMVGKWLLW